MKITDQQLLDEFIGNENNLINHKIFIQITGSHDQAQFLSRLWYWQSRTRISGNWIAKTYEDWHMETLIPEHSIRRYSKKFIEIGVLESTVMKFAGSPTMHYRLNKDSLSILLKKFIAEREQLKTDLRQEMSDDSSKNKYDITKKYIKRLKEIRESIFVPNNLSGTFPTICKERSQQSARNVPNKLPGTITSSTNKNYNNNLKQESRSKSAKASPTWLTNFIEKNNLEHLQKFDIQPSKKWLSSKLQEKGESIVSEIFLAIEAKCVRDPNYIFSVKSLSGVFNTFSKKRKSKFQEACENVFKEEFFATFNSGYSFDAKGKSKNLMTLVNKIAKQNQVEGNEQASVERLQKFLQDLPEANKSAKEFKPALLNYNFDNLKLSSNHEKQTNNNRKGKSGFSCGEQTKSRIAKAMGSWK